MDNGEAFKEICAHYGAAMYFAQVLEHGIANALIFVDLIPRTNGKWTPEEYDTYFERSFEKTLGNLIKHLKSVTDIPDTLIALLEDSKNKRAFLAHHFFRERTDALHRHEYDEIIQELESTRLFFEATDKELQNFVEPLMQRYGFTDEEMEKALAGYKEHIGATSN
ncbi:hypothetical protein [Aquipseudomonas ullengensis]|uniref:Uncharacterized protein n=1 Tax=Aquipseudomonas ullengensis TaxID=2759166 RepID=A0A7W4QFT8_9GAMM|nr:hypothetical protein [Pseudomonas ullengensis]MBB2496998.1 hypothetical protein [Pseudomonas ullengensis]